MSAWLEEHWPDTRGRPCSAGATLAYGNVMYRDFEPVAVLDWEMAAVAPPELDLAYLVYMHRVLRGHRPTATASPACPTSVALDELRRASTRPTTGYAPP